MTDLTTESTFLSVLLFLDRKAEDPSSVRDKELFRIPHPLKHLYPFPVSTWDSGEDKL